ncbi:DUF4389 domain-containing protein [Plastorhodobacter daqingensis]|uniref:DUF4389 domain-containing protein n=1 Tax=Plastorhodobacter daqingensis TaxID=1387281 RepID=A0ABW2UFV1_9RHOB
MSHPSEPDPVLPAPERLWRRGLIMVLLVLLINLAQTALGLCAVLQFFWMLFASQRNPGIARLGAGIGAWLAMAGRYVAGASDHLPFPWTEWTDQPRG